MWLRGSGAAFGWLASRPIHDDEDVPWWSETTTYAYDGEGLLHMPDELASVRTIHDGCRASCGG